MGISELHPHFVIVKVYFNLNGVGNKYYDGFWNSLDGCKNNNIPWRMYTWFNYKDMKKIIANNLFVNYKKSYMGSSKHHEYVMRGLMVIYSKVTLNNVIKHQHLCAGGIKKTNCLFCALCRWLLVFSKNVNEILILNVIIWFFLGHSID
jgi:hypothetical protein